MTVRSASRTRRMSQGVLSIWTRCQGAAAPGCDAVSRVSDRGFARPFAPADQPYLITRPNPCPDGLGAGRGKAGRLAASRDFVGQALQRRPGPLGIVLVNGLLDDGFPAGTQPLRARSMPRRQELSDLGAAHLGPSRQVPDAAWRDAERRCGGRNISGCSRRLAGQCREQPMSARGLGPVGVERNSSIEGNECPVGGETSAGRTFSGSADTSSPVSERSSTASTPRARCTRQRAPAYSTRDPVPNCGDIPCEHISAY